MEILGCEEIIPVLFYASSEKSEWFLCLSTSFYK